MIDVGRRQSGIPHDPAPHLLPMIQSWEDAEAGHGGTDPSRELCANPSPELCVVAKMQNISLFPGERIAARTLDGMSDVLAGILSCLCVVLCFPHLGYMIVVGHSVPQIMGRCGAAGELIHPPIAPVC